MNDIPSVHGPIQVTDDTGVCRHWKSVAIMQNLHHEPQERETSHADDCILIERKYLPALIEELRRYL